MDGVIGLGGGSAMDVAKAAAILAKHGGPLARFEGADRVPPGRLPLACIATTAGTGSEATRYLIVTDEARDRKMLVSTWECLPDVAVADPALTRYVPTRAAVAAGIDAFTHALEAYVSRRAQPLTDGLALNAIRRIVPALPRVVADPSDDLAREAMSMGALEAGIAFANASVALVHGMARPLGARFGIAHGMANAVLLPIVCGWSWPAAPARYRDIGAAMGAIATQGDTPVPRCVFRWHGSRRRHGTLTALQSCSRVPVGAVGGTGAEGTHDAGRWTASYSWRATLGRNRPPADVSRRGPD